MNLTIFFGPPGSGKGTQSDFLKESLNYKKISTGDALREIASKGTDLGKEVSRLMSEGKLISDEIVSEVVVSSMADLKGYDGVILDGYPRTLNQAEFLDGYLKKESSALLESLKIIEIDVHDDLLVERICGRYVCAKCSATYHKKFRPTKVAGKCDFCPSEEFTSRADDNEDTVKNRLVEYHKNFLPIKKFYQGGYDLVVINGDQDIAKIRTEILDSVKG